MKFLLSFLFTFNVFAAVNLDKELVIQAVQKDQRVQAAVKNHLSSFDMWTGGWGEPTLTWKAIVVSHDGTQNIGHVSRHDNLIITATGHLNMDWTNISNTLVISVSDGYFFNSNMGVLDPSVKMVDEYTRIHKILTEDELFPLPKVKKIDIKDLLLEVTEIH
jgi:hypothetical protein